MAKKPASRTAPTRSKLSRAVPKKKPASKKPAPKKSPRAKAPREKLAPKPASSAKIKPKSPAHELLLRRVDYREVAADYAKRLAVHGHLVDLFRRGRAGTYAVAALGMVEPMANQSAREHDLGPRILRRCSPQRILELARSLMALPDCAELPSAVRAADIDWLKISAASEMAAMLDPSRFWVTNLRTVWAHRMVSQNWNAAKADEELRLYRDYERDAAMEFGMWSGLHREVGPSLQRLARLGGEAARAKKAPVGEHPYLWAGSLAAWLFEHRALPAQGAGRG